MSSLFVSQPSLLYMYTGNCVPIRRLTDAGRPPVQRARHPVRLNVVTSPPKHRKQGPERRVHVNVEDALLGCGRVQPRPCEKKEQILWSHRVRPHVLPEFLFFEYCGHGLISRLTTVRSASFNVSHDGDCHERENAGSCWEVAGGSVEDASCRQIKKDLHKVNTYYFLFFLRRSHGLFHTSRKSFHNSFGIFHLATPSRRVHFKEHSITSQVSESVKRTEQAHGLFYFSAKLVECNKYRSWVHSQFL